MTEILLAVALAGVLAGMLIGSVALYLVAHWVARRQRWEWENIDRPRIERTAYGDD